MQAKVQCTRPLQGALIGYFSHRGQVWAVGKDVPGSVVESEHEVTTQLLDVRAPEQELFEPVRKIAEIVTGREPAGEGRGQDRPHAVMCGTRREPGGDHLLAVRGHVLHAENLNGTPDREMDVAAESARHLRQGGPVLGPQPSAGEPEAQRVGGGVGVGVRHGHRA